MWSVAKVMATVEHRSGVQAVWNAMCMATPLAFRSSAHKTGRVSRANAAYDRSHIQVENSHALLPPGLVGLGVGPSLFPSPNKGSGAPRRRMAWISPDRPDLTGGPGTPGPWRT